MGFLVQSENGDLVVVVPRHGGGVQQFWRDGSLPDHPWYGPSIPFGSAGDVSGTALATSSLDGADMEVVCAEGGTLVNVGRQRAHLGRWKGRTPLPGSVPPGSGPSILSPAGETVDVVSPLAGGGMGHWLRDGAGWHGPSGFGGGDVAAAAVAFSGYGHLEVVARAGESLRHWWRDEAGTWQPGPEFGGGASGHHDLLVDRHGELQVLAPLVAGGAGHWSRGGPPEHAWSGPVVVGTGPVAAAALAEHSTGNLEAVVRAGDGLEHWWREPAGTWNGPTAFGTAPPSDPRAVGDCTVRFDTGTVGVHAVLVRTGKVVAFGFADRDVAQGDSRVLDPSTGAAERPLNAHHHLFCSGHAVDGSGRVVVAGGHHADIAKIHTFDPEIVAWMQAPRLMQKGRWYPTCTTLPDGRVLVMSGTTLDGPPSATNPVNDTVQVVDETGPQEERPIPRPFSAWFPPGLPTIDLYPFVFVLPTGELLVHSRHVTRFYDPAADRWSGTEAVTGHPFSRTYPGAGTAVLLALRPEEDYWARVLVAGGGGGDPGQLDQDTPATTSAEILDMGAQPPTWRAVSPMQFARVMPDGVLLPDGTVAVIGGSSRGVAEHAVDPVLAVELFDPVTARFSTVCSIHAPRLYHSTALLLPDASVLVAGKDALFNADPYDYPERRGEIFRPPYLFRGARPVVDGAPDRVGYRAPFTVHTGQASAIASIVLMRPGSVTHSFNMDQRLVELEITARRTGRVEVTGPPDANVAPPGYHMLFVLDHWGVPSVARFVHLM